MEVLVVDGMSDDGTREVVKEYVQRFSCVRLVDNPRLIAPTALNIGIELARGDVIVRVDAHALYPPDYISKLVGWLERSGADNVGGSFVTVPANEGALARGIAAALSHPFGVGNSYFRIGSSKKSRLVDTVPFGCYPRSVFQRIGLFDEDLVRDQDDEFNARLISAGGRILLVPDVVCQYVARDSLKKLFRMHFEYGAYKPLATRRAGRLYTVRQLVPPVFVVSVVGLAALSAIVPLARLALLAVAAIYAVGALVSAATAPRGVGLLGRLWMCLAFPVMHVGYGVGYLAGLVRLRRRRDSGRVSGNGSSSIDKAVSRLS